MTYCPYWLGLGFFENEKKLLNAGMQMIPNKYSLTPVEKASQCGNEGKKCLTEESG